MTLQHAERYLRRYDKLLRLRHSADQPTILVERKTSVGRIGARNPATGRDYEFQDSGARRELGHVHVAAIHQDVFDVRTLLESLKLADTWKWDEPLVDKIEKRERMAEADKKRKRESDLRYKAAEVFSRYVTKFKQRAYVPDQIS